MTLTTLTIGVAIAALILTLVGKFAFDRVENYFISYLQNFTGALFIFSGWVKAIDPLGTAYKMEQYFAEFESTFQDTWFSFLAPLFPQLSEYSASFSVFMIVLEIVLGVMLLVGMWRSFTAWTFFLIVAFFTFLTGFTYLTGYVPEGVNFFQFGKWGEYVSTNMKVTDCGCFGDFLKLEPRISFFKDLILLIPAITFLFKWKDMHQLFNGAGRFAIAAATTLGLLFYCYSNYVWDLPHTDFRPFKNTIDIAATKAAEEEAAANVDIIAYKLENKSTGEVVEFPYDEYLKKYQEYPSSEWESEQIKTEPVIPSTKISEFEVSNSEGEGLTEEILSDPNYTFWLVAYKLKAEETKGLAIVYDSVFVQDSILIGDSLNIQQRLQDVKKRQIETTVYNWDEKYLTPWKEIVLPMLEEAQKDNIQSLAITSYANPEKLSSFKEASAYEAEIYQADDILLKTIIRSNPGVILMKEGKIIQKWHYKKLPSYQEIKSTYIK